MHYDDPADRILLPKINDWMDEFNEDKKTLR